MSLRTSALPVLLLGISLDVALLAGAILEWNDAWHPYRGTMLGLLTGVSGLVLFWAGVRFSMRGENAPGFPPVSQGPSRDSRGQDVSQDEAKRWLQKFLEEQQRRNRTAS